MKKFILMLLLLIPFLTGCATIDTTLTINNNKSAAIATNLKSSENATPLELLTLKANYRKFLDNNYKIEDNTKRNNIDINATKSVKNLAKEDIDLSSLGFKSNFESGRFVEVKKNFFVTSYNIHMTYNYKNKINQVELIKTVTKPKKNNSGLQPEYFQKYADKTLLIDDKTSGMADFIANFEANLISESEIKQQKNTKEIQIEEDNYTPFDINNLTTNFSIKLPSFASYNNADTNEGYVYSWELRKNSPTEIKLQYVVYSGYAITFIILVGILFFAYIARRIRRHDMLKRIGNNN